MDERQRSRLFEGAAGFHPHLGGALPSIEELFNYSLREYNLGVWSELRGYQAPHFAIFEGISDVDGMLRGLAEQGFEETDYNARPIGGSMRTIDSTSAAIPFVSSSHHGTGSP